MVITTDIRNHYYRFVSILAYHKTSRTWPWKMVSQMIYLTVFFIIIFLPLKFVLSGIPLRSTPRPLPIGASPRILDIPNFQWLMNNETACNKEPSTSKIMVILVHSARENFMERSSIRNTWGSLKRYKNWTIRVIFLLGDFNPDPALDDKLSTQIYTELNYNGDIVVGNFIDTYQNLRYKHLMGYKWILNYCPEATYVWKVDDDVFIDPLTIVEWRNSEIDNAEQSVDESNGPSKMIDFYCPISSNSKPQRDPSLKWFVPEEMWPLSEYPTYCSGWAYGISVPWIRDIFAVSELVNKALWIDDIFVTGVLVQLVNKLEQKTPILKNTWPYSTFIYDPVKTTFCIDGELALRDVPKTQRKFGAFGRLLRGRTLLRENECIWDSIISGRWDPLKMQND